MNGGWLTLARIRGAPLRLHWSLPIGLAVVGGLRWAPGRWLGFLAVLLVHELGHALLAWRAGLHVHGLELHALGGLCRYEGGASPYRRSVIAWGGVLAQMALLAATAAAIALTHFTRTGFGLDLAESLTGINAGIALFNLLPIRGLDGSDAWRVFGHWLRGEQRRQMTRPQLVVLRREAPPKRPAGDDRFREMRRQLELIASEHDDDDDEESPSPRRRDRLH